MTRGRASDPVSAPILSLLSPERRQEILEEAVGARARSLLDSHRTGTLGGLVDALVGHPHWPYLQLLPVANLLATPRPAAPLEPAPSRSLEASPAAPVVPRSSRPLDATPPAPPPQARVAPRTVAARHSPPPRTPSVPLTAPSRPAAPAIAPVASPAILEQPPPASAAPPVPEIVPQDEEGIAIAARAVAELLSENDERPIEEIRRVIRVWTLDLARAAYQKTVEIEAAGGLVRDGHRKSLGGVFFFLSKTAAGREMLGPAYAELKRIPQPVPPPTPPMPRAPRPPAPAPVVVRKAGRHHGPAAARSMLAARPVAPRPVAPPPSVAPRRSGDLMEAMVGFIARNPGLREDEICARLAGDRMLVRATLDALRAHRRVRTMGSGRAMTYTVAG